MTLPSSGTITLAMIQAEFGGPTPIQLTNYYLSGAYVANSAANAGIPTSGTLTIPSQFYGAAAFAPVTNTYTTASTFTETVPTGASSCTISVWGGGASGALENSGTVGGGGASGFSSKSIAVTGGNTFSVTVGTFGVGQTTSPGNGYGGSDSTVTGTVSGGSVSMTANGGSGGQTTAGGAGGAATGGTTNTTGASGTLGSPGSGGAGTGGFGGGGAGNNTGGVSLRGQPARVSFAYT